MLEGILEAMERMYHRITGPRLTVTAITITAVGATITPTLAQEAIRLIIIMDGKKVG
jgi:hypothetical protein